MGFHRWHLPGVCKAANYGPRGVVLWLLPGPRPLKYQAIVTPDGLINSLTQHFPGPHNDWRLLIESGILPRLREIMAGQETLYLYGDPAYNSQWGILAPYQHGGGRRFLTPQQIQFNSHLSRARIAVENALGLVQNFFTKTGFGEALQPGKQELGAYYLVSGLFTNFLTCFRGNHVGIRFGCRHPDIFEYLGVTESREHMQNQL